ncbi:peptidylprolyl isomerase [Flavisolibacter tropicus]|uniref:Peptidylprolyl isomerase n=1 Tax=Flavisolibacter tropicus TaxID=1492898 RepID=A0A172TWF1_9BACT|nr:peptidylprolyl isomerase [Flavisolibacter tropicus]ANE51360.1 peptidylprolyl isomerase [Flavisolibacter tropicus]
MKKVFSFLLGLVGITSFATAQTQKAVADKIVGVVGDRIILYSDIKNAIADAARQGNPVPADAECQILEQALVSKLLMLQAEKDSLPVSDEEIEAELDQRIRYFINAYGSQQQLETIAGKTIYQIKDDARESVRENKLAQAMQRKIVESVRITPTEAKAYFDRIPKDSLPFFETEVEIGQIAVFPKASRDLEKYVIDELNNYKKQVEMRITSFDQLAKQYSEDPGSKDRGGQYQINRTEKTWDPAFLSAAFRLKEGEISPVIKSKFGYHIIQMVQRNGDDAIVKHILRVPPVTDAELAAGRSKLDSVRAKLIAGTLDFSTAAGRYSEDEAAKFSGPFITSKTTGSTYLTIDELDKDVVAQLDKLKLGEYSQPINFADERGKKGVRILYLKSRTEPHRMNMRDDYNKIATAALEEKKMQVLDKWMSNRISTHYIMVDPTIGNCQQLEKWKGAAKLATN